MLRFSRLDVTPHLQKCNCWKIKTFLLFQDQEHVDLTIGCEDGNISAHKVVLSSSSQYFRHTTRPFLDCLYQDYRLAAEIVLELSFPCSSGLFGTLFRLLVFSSVSDPYPLNPDPAKNLNPDLDPEDP